ncbi:hypothetical protein Ddye_009820 [Dipteronia dyeriana]|uniref:Uncharacterized protein n=1 Tax=Dipteronia dyeriana TaxID=168575 RepID=A0AAD9XD54_9ROSI|nr:hypothetical protein Ddye_009820 [Dipteronia dyeriana]
MPSLSLRSGRDWRSWSSIVAMAAKSVMELDLLSLDSVARFVEAWNARLGPWHVLINNAGIFSIGGVEIVDELNGAQEDEVTDELNGAQEEYNIRRRKRFRKLASVVHTPYTIPRKVKDMVYLIWRFTLEGVPGDVKLSTVFYVFCVIYLVGW